MLSDFVNFTLSSICIFLSLISSPSFSSSSSCLWGVLHTFALSSANAKTPSLNELGVRCKKVLDTNVKGIGQQKGGKRERERGKNKRFSQLSEIFVLIELFAAFCCCFCCWIVARFISSTVVLLLRLFSLVSRLLSSSVSNSTAISVCLCTLSVISQQIFKLPASVFVLLHCFSLCFSCLLQTPPSAFPSFTIIHESCPVKSLCFIMAYLSLKIIRCSLIGQVGNF